MNIDHPPEPPRLWPYAVLSWSLLLLFVGACVWLVAEVVALIVGATFPALVGALKARRVPVPAWVEDALELARLTQEIGDRIVEGLDTLDRPLFGFVRWIWKRAHVEHWITVSALVLDIVSTAIDRGIYKVHPREIDR